MKKIVSIALVLVMLCSAFVGCDLGYKENFHEDIRDLIINKDYSIDNNEETRVNSTPPVDKWDQYFNGNKENGSNSNNTMDDKDEAKSQNEYAHVGKKGYCYTCNRKLNGKSYTKLFLGNYVEMCASCSNNSWCAGCGWQLGDWCAIKYYNGEKLSICRNCGDERNCDFCGCEIWFIRRHLIEIDGWLKYICDSCYNEAEQSGMEFNYRPNSDR